MTASYSSGQAGWTLAAPVVDRGSTFAARAVRISGPDEVRTRLDEVLQEKKIAKASHPAMYAWRCGAGPPGSTAVQQGKADDGESGAGTVLANLLESMDARDTLVVCTRWYGGTPLGPARFRHIATTAKEALRAGGFVAEPMADGDQGKARAKGKKKGK